MSHLKVAVELFSHQIQELENVKINLGNNFNEAVDAMFKADRVIVSGIGKTGIIGKKIVSTLNSTGTKSSFLNAAEAIHGDLGKVSKEDVVLIISNSGKTKETLQIIDSLKQLKVCLIAMTGNLKSPLAKSVDIVLNVGVSSEGSQTEIAPMSSTTATLVMGDALAESLVRCNNFTKEDFKKFHPGGALGKMFLTVGDVMITDNLPLVSSDSCISEIIHELTLKREGCVCVVDSNKILLGLITDGDIRNSLNNKDVFFKLKASDIMTKEPHWFSPNKKVYEALEFTQSIEHEINVLPILIDDILVGLVRIHDLV